MTYWVRGFCTDGEVPTIGTILAWAADHGVDLHPPAEMPEFVSRVGEPLSDWEPWTPEELARRDWEAVALWWRKVWTLLDISIGDRHDGEVAGLSAATRYRASLATT